MPLNQLTQSERMNDSETLLIERLPEHDSKLNKIRLLLYEQLGIKAARTMRIFTRFEVQGLSMDELRQVNYQVFSTLGLDHLVNPIELLEQEYVLGITPVESLEDCLASSALNLLRFYYPYRQIRIRRSNILIFKDNISITEKTLIEDWFLKDTGMEKTLLRPADDLVVNDLQPKSLETINNFNEFDLDKWNQLAKDFDLQINSKAFKTIKSLFNSLKREPTLTELLLLNWFWYEQYLAKLSNPVFTISDFSKIKNNKIKDSLLEFLASLKINKTAINNVFKFSDLSKQADSAVSSYQASKKRDLNLENYYNFRKKIESFDDNDLLFTSNALSNLLKSSFVNSENTSQTIRISIVNSNLLDKKCINKKTSLFAKKKKAKLKKIRALNREAKKYSDYAKLSNLPVSFAKEYYTDNFFHNNLEIAASLTNNIENHFNKDPLRENDLIVILGEKINDDYKQNSSKADINSLLFNFFLRNKVKMMTKKIKYLDETGLLPSVSQLKLGAKVNLDVLLLGRSNLDASQISFAKTKDRMLAIVSPDYRDSFIKEVNNSDLEARVIGSLTKTSKIIVFYYGQKVVDLNKKDLYFKQADHKINLSLTDSLTPNNKTKNKAFSHYLLEKLQDLNIASQDNFNNLFADHIEKPDDFSIITESNTLDLIQTNPYAAGYLSVYNALVKNVSLGGNPETAYLSLNKILFWSNNIEWNKMFLAMLGVYQARIDYQLPLLDDEDILLDLVEDKTGYDKLSLPSKPLIISYILNSKSKTNINKNKTGRKDNIHAYLLKTKESDSIPDKQEAQTVLINLHQSLANNELKDIILVEKDIASQIFKKCVAEDVGFKFSSKLKNIDLFQNNYHKIIVFSELKPDQILIVGTNTLYLGKTIKNTSLIRRNNSIKVQLANKTYRQALANVYPSDVLFESELPENKIRIFENQINAEAALNQLDFVNQETNEFKTRIPSKKSQKIKIVIPLFRGIIGTKQIIDKFSPYNVDLSFPKFYYSTEEKRQKSFKEISHEIAQADALFLASGYSLTDQANGVAKLLCLMLEQESIKQSVSDLLETGGKVIGVGNGFQALVSCGLLPYGRYRSWGDKQGYFKDHFPFCSSSKNIEFEVVSNKGNWYKKESQILSSVLLTNYFALQMPSSLWRYCIDNQLIVTKFINAKYNYVESLTSPCGNVYGRLTHPEFTSNHSSLNHAEDDFFKNLIENVKS